MHGEEEYEDEEYEDEGGFLRELALVGGYLLLLVMVGACLLLLVAEVGEKCEEVGGAGSQTEDKQAKSLGNKDTSGKGGDYFKNRYGDGLAYV